MTNPAIRMFAPAAISAMLLPSVVAAQTSEDTFARLQSLLRPGQAVIVTDDAGRRFEGLVDAITPASLTLGVSRKRNPTGLQSFTDANLMRVESRDSLFNGTLIGLAAGGAAALAFVAGSCGDDAECQANVGVLTVAFLPAGALAGAVVDSAVRRTLYKVPLGRRGATLTAVPVIGLGRQGALVFVRF